MVSARSIVKRIAQQGAAVNARRKLSDVRGAGGALAEAVADAIQAVLDDTMSPEERAWSERIEAARARLSASRDVLVKVDYGAGKPGAERSEEEMAEGVEKTLTVGEACRASKPRFWASLLFHLVRKSGVTSGVELGTCLGISCAYQGAAMLLNGAGSMVTMEGAEAVAAVAERNLEELGVSNARVVRGRFEDRLDEVLPEATPIDYAFIDGHHEEKATLRYFERFLPHLAERSVLVFDDVAWSAGMKRAWRALEARPEVGLSLDLRTVGICVLDPDIHTKTTLRIPLLSV